MLVSEKAQMEGHGGPGGLTQAPASVCMQGRLLRFLLGFLQTEQMTSFLGKSGSGKELL